MPWNLVIRTDDAIKRHGGDGFEVLHAFQANVAALTRW
jgi:hypothetical protein